MTSSAGNPILLERTEPGRPGWRVLRDYPLRPLLTCVYADCRATYTLTPDHDLQAGDGLIQPAVACPGCERMEVYQLIGWSAHLMDLYRVIGADNVPELAEEPRLLDFG